MSKIIIVYCSEKYPYHVRLVHKIKGTAEEKGHKVLLLDTAGNKKKEAYREVKKDEADLLITLDLEGFSWGTESGSIFYNLLSCKSIHFLFGDKKEYGEYLSNKLSIAMFFYLVGETDEMAEEMRQKYPNISFIKAVPAVEELDARDVLEEVESEIGKVWGR